MNRDVAHLSLCELKMEREHCYFICDKWKDNYLTTTRRHLMENETELFARGELNEWECQAMLASFLLPSDKLPADLRKFREAPEGGSGRYTIWTEDMRFVNRCYEALTELEIMKAELVPTFEFQTEFCSKFKA